jgi:hypothetical protein
VLWAAEAKKLVERQVRLIQAGEGVA